MTDPTVEEIVAAMECQLAFHAPILSFTREQTKTLIASWRERGEALKAVWTQEQVKTACDKTVAAMQEGERLAIASTRAKAIEECEAIAREHDDPLTGGSVVARRIADAIAAIKKAG